MKSTPAKPLTVGELLTFFIPRLADENQRHIPPWPPDVFGLMSALIQRSGAYLQALENWPPERYSIPRDGYADWATVQGKQWRKAALFRQDTPDLIQQMWKGLLKRASSLAISEFQKDQVAAHDALLLLALSDEASKGLGAAVSYENSDLETFELWMRSVASPHPEFRRIFPS